MFELIAGPILNIIDKVIPDPAQREAAKLELLKQQQSGEIQQVQAQLSAIIAEAKSADPFTSRARPSFLYVIYIFILSAIPMGFLFAYDPETTKNITTGVGEWLRVLPDELYALFGVGYLGYTGARTLDKRAQLKAGSTPSFGPQLPWQK